MPRPGPLQELPLDLFLSNPNLLHPAPFKSNKRPLSPGTPVLYSPAKRRILNEAGIFSPEKTHKTPLPASRTNQSRFADVFAGPDSPAAKLDFGPPKNQAQSKATASLVQDDDDSVTSSRVLSLSRVLSPSSAQTAVSTRTVATTSRSSGSNFDGPSDYFDHCPSSSHSALEPAFMPRELPLNPDPRSIHYPGFLIYRDPHFVAFSAPVLSSSYVYTNEEYKENIIPNTGRQSSCIHDNGDAIIRSALVPKDGEMIHSPHSHCKDSNSLLTPRKTPRIPSMSSCVRTELGVVKSTPRLNKEHRREMRRLLEEEVNYAESDDDSASPLS